MKKNIPLFKVFMSDTAVDAVSDVLRSGFVGEGTQTKNFELELQERLENDYVATTNSATSAEHLALHLMKKKFGLKDGDEILATPLTCTASNWPILANNFKIKWVDVDPDTLNMDLDDLERKISPTTKGLMLVHWGGYPVDLNRIDELKKKTKELFGFELAVVEDCAHAFGSTFEGKPLGNHGNYATYSFQAIKHMTSVDGGCLVCPTSGEYKRARLVRWYGIDRESDRKDFRCEADIPEWGYKFHMNDVMAAVGRANLREVDKVIEAHRANALFYDNELSSVPGLTIPQREGNRESSFWIYSMLVDDKKGFMKHMAECGITVSQVHERNDKHSCVKEFVTHLPSLEKITPKLISIPVGWWVTKEDREYIVKCIKEGW